MPDHAIEKADVFELVHSQLADAGCIGEVELRWDVDILNGTDLLVVTHRLDGIREVMALPIHIATEIALAKDLSVKIIEAMQRAAQRRAAKAAR